MGIHDRQSYDRDQTCRVCGGEADDWDGLCEACLRDIAEADEAYERELLETQEAEAFHADDLDAWIASHEHALPWERSWAPSIATARLHAILDAAIEGVCL